MNTLLKASIIIALLSSAHAANAAVVDIDSDGLIEINNLDDLNEIRNDLTGKTFRGGSDGCPSNGCFGWELTRDLNFDSNGNGVIDAGDWNSGNPWTPFTGFNNVVFEGNSHAIANLLTTTPDIYSTPSGGTYRYGFIAALFNSTVRNLRLVKPTVLADASPIPTNYAFSAGALSAVAIDSELLNCTLENGTVNVTRPSILAKLQNTGTVGGVVGMSFFNSQRSPILSNVHFSGSVSVQDALQFHFAGGIAGSLNANTLLDSSSHGSVTGPAAGGLSGGVNGTTLFNSYSTAAATATNGNAGGLVAFNNTSTFDSVYATGAVSAPISWPGGGLIGFENTNGNVELNNSYSMSIVNGSNVQLIGLKSGNAVILNNGTYQVGDPAGTPLPSSPMAYNRSITNAGLKCATNPVDTSCSAPFAVESWNPNVWDFGTATELPLLHQDSNSPWVSVDSPKNGTGDYESIANVKNKYPQYACDAPVDFQVKAKKSAYVFSANTPEKFDFFNSVQGLQCTASAQVDGSCSNYEVSYLCDLRAASGSTYWTAWSSNDNPNTAGAADKDDTETPPNAVCGNGITAGIRARVAGTTQEYLGAPQKVSKLNLTYGFACKNADNGAGASCKDYEVRMVCSNKTLLTNP